MKFRPTYQITYSSVIKPGQIRMLNYDYFGQKYNGPVRIIERDQSYDFMWKVETLKGKIKYFLGGETRVGRFHKRYFVYRKPKV
jgi:hypothetical protein